MAPRAAPGQTHTTLAAEPVAAVTKPVATTFRDGGSAFSGEVLVRANGERRRLRGALSELT